MEPPYRLVRNHVQRMARLAGAAEPLGRLEPSGVAGTVVIAEAVDGFRKNLDPPRRGLQGVRLRIAAKGAEADTLAVVKGQFDMAVAPEIVEFGQLDSATCWRNTS